MSSINRLIGESLKRVDSGHRVSAQARDAFGRIVEGVEQTTASVEQITGATEAQLDTARRVDALIHALSDATGTSTAGDVAVQRKAS